MSQPEYSGHETPGSHVDCLRRLEAKDAEIAEFKSIRALLIKALAAAVGRPETDVAMLEAPLTVALAHKAEIAELRCKLAYKDGQILKLGNDLNDVHATLDKLKAFIDSSRSTHKSVAIDT